MATKNWTEGVEVRRHNGQCDYGQWLDIDDENVPTWVDALVADEIAETDDSGGRIEQGGSIWLWRKIPMRYCIEATDDTAGSGWSPEAAGNTDNVFETEEDAEECRQALIALGEDWTEDNTRVSEYPDR